MDAQIRSVIEEKEQYYEKIHDARKRIADAKDSIARERIDAWADAEGTVDQKKDYVKSVIVEYTTEINSAEADIEYYYNMIEILNDKLVYEDE